MQQYLSAVCETLETGTRKGNRTGRSARVVASGFAS